MSAREQLHQYIVGIERRLRWLARLRGAAIVAATALVATVGLVAVANYFAFSSASVNGARLTLLIALAAAAVAGLWFPLRRLTARRAVARLEAAFPEFGQRLVTFHDKNDANPFLELLAADTLRHAEAAPAEQLAPGAWLYSSLGAGLASCAVLIWLVAAGPGFLGYGAALLWTGPRKSAAPLYSLKVTPGNAVIRRHGDQLVTAVPSGWTSPAVKLFARYQGGAGWEAAAMQAQPGGAAYHYLFAGLPSDVDYYVAAGELRSPVYHLKVRDLPAVKQISATYHYPAWTGIKDSTEAHAGDLRAPAGTRAQLEITTDQPLANGELVVDDRQGNSQTITLTPDGTNRYRGTIAMAKDGVYHLAALMPGETAAARLSEDFFISAPPPTPPQIALVRPQRDYRASPIEEVTVAAQASDQFGLKSLTLHYSVNGEPEKTVPLAVPGGAKSAKGATVLSLEDFKAQPGDVISVYASASDGNSDAALATARTDMEFIQADPYERDFSQSQQSGGGGGGGGQGNASAQITEREKEIIAGTFRQQNDHSGNAQLASDTAKLLAESQATLHDQAMSLSGRMESRELTDENQAFSDFQKDMIAAAAAMQPAAQSLGSQKWTAAMPNEEKALRSLLKAEATFRQIQIAFGARGGGGGGGGSSAARDLASLFDLELDTQKNQYETQQTASSQEQKAQTIDDTLKKLDELARRQQDLAQPQDQQQTAEQRWQQEMLRREAEQLQQQLQQLAQNGQQGQSGSSQSAQGSQGSNNSASSQNGQRSNSSQSAQGSNGSAGSPNSPSSNSSNAQSAEGRAAAQALDRVRQAQQQMQRAASEAGNPRQQAADAAQAAENLRLARQALAGLQQQNADQRLAGMASEADQLAGEQKQQADQVRQMIASHANPDQRTVDNLVQGRQQISDQLDQLQTEMRNAARDLNGTQPAASDQLRNALQGLDGNDLTTRVQRSADWLRQGNFSDQSESSITHDLQQLGQQLRQSQQALSGTPGQANNAAIASAMDQIERLRQQIAGGDANVRGQAGEQRGQGSTNRQGPAGQQFQPGQLSRNGQAGQQSQQGGQQTAQNGGGRNGGRQPGGSQASGSQASDSQAGRGGAQGGRAGGNGANGRIGNRVAGQNGGARNGYRDGPVGNQVAAGGDRNRNYGNGGYDFGNTHIVGQAVTPQQGPNPADTQRAIEQDLEALNNIRQSLPKDGATQRAVQDLIAQTRNLDPSRFPGNPEMVAEMHQELLHSMDTLELSLRKQLDKSQGGQIRGRDPQPAPPGYDDAVAAYFKRLSATGGGH